VKRTLRIRVKKVQSEKKFWFSALCIRNGLTLTDLQIEQMDQYVNMLLDWNRKINLISRKDEENVWTYHILHSVSPLFKVKMIEGSKIVDIGSGGGLPGIPLKILRPDISLLCLDATRKKTDAVSQIVDELKIKDINVIWGRAEEVGLQSEYLHKFDFAIARAVCQLSELIPLSINFLKRQDCSSLPESRINHGFIDANPPALIAFKGGDMAGEIDVAKRRYPQMHVNTINLAFAGSEQLIVSDKKILVVHL
jgi:16S rRNA (guanine(527)-N(7))-methyltransferase RsmG